MAVLNRTIGRDQGDAIKVCLDGGHLSEQLAVSSIAARFGVRELVTALVGRDLSRLAYEACLQAWRRQVAA